jgi:hypothetical protein
MRRLRGPDVATIRIVGKTRPPAARDRSSRTIPDRTELSMLTATVLVPVPWGRWPPRCTRRYGTGRSLRAMRNAVAAQTVGQVESGEEAIG